MHDIKISKFKISNIVKQKVKKNSQSLLLHGEMTSNEYGKKASSASNFSEVSSNKKKFINAEINGKVLKFTFSNNIKSRFIT